MAEVDPITQKAERLLWIVDRSECTEAIAAALRDERYSALDPLCPRNHDEETEHDCADAILREREQLKLRLRTEERELNMLRDAINGACRCQACGELYREDVLLPDEMWNEIRPAGKPPGGGLLCGRCIGAVMYARLVRAQDDFRKLQAVVNGLEDRLMHLRGYLPPEVRAEEERAACCVGGHEGCIHA